MALCLPVVSTNVGGISYLFEHNLNALLFEDEYVDGIKNKIKRLFTEPNLILNLSKKGKESVESFDWEIVKKQWIELLV
jgi:glycosyltransferase involved in cell wall biosynthesis